MQEDQLKEEREEGGGGCGVCGRGKRLPRSVRPVGEKSLLVDGAAHGGPGANGMRRSSAGQELPPPGW